MFTLELAALSFSVEVLATLEYFVTRDSLVRRVLKLCLFTIPDPNLFGLHIWNYFIYQFKETGPFDGYSSTTVTLHHRGINHFNKVIKVVINGHCRYVYPDNLRQYTYALVPYEQERLDIREPLSVKIEGEIDPSFKAIADRAKFFTVPDNDRPKSIVKKKKAKFAPPPVAKSGPEVVEIQRVLLDINVASTREDQETELLRVKRVPKPEIGTVERTLMRPLRGKVTEERRKKGKVVEEITPQVSAEEYRQQYEAARFLQKLKEKSR